MQVESEKLNLFVDEDEDEVEEEDEKPFVTYGLTPYG